MNKKIIKTINSGLLKEVTVGLASVGLSFIHPFFAPIPGIAWEGAKLLLTNTNANNVLKERFIEFLTFAGKNKELLKKNSTDSNAISGLISLYEFTMKQRFEKKRTKAFKIFLGLLNSSDRENFELERMYNTLNLMSLSDIQTFSQINDPVLLSLNFNTFEKYTHLISLGILYETAKSQISAQYAGGDKVFKLTSFGKELKESIEFGNNSYTPVYF